MSRSKTILKSVAMVLLLSACAVPAWVPPADHPADPGALDGNRTHPTALKRYREAAATAETSNAPTSETESALGSEEHGHHHHGDQDVKP